MALLSENAMDIGWADPGNICKVIMRTAQGDEKISSRRAL